MQRLAETPDSVLFSLPTADGGWSPVTTREFYDQVIALAKGLVAAGIQPGDKIGLMCKTRYEWTLIDFATWFAGAVLVPIYETSSPAQVKWNLSDSGAIAVIVETPDHFARFDEVHPELPAIRNVWQIDLGDLDKLAAAGTAVPDEEIERRRNLAVGSDIATLIYTSGSTGKPKGCVLTHSNFVETSRNAAIALKEVVLDPTAPRRSSSSRPRTSSRDSSPCSACTPACASATSPTPSNCCPRSAASSRRSSLRCRGCSRRSTTSRSRRPKPVARAGSSAAAADTAVAYSTAKEAGHVPFGLNLKFRVFDRLVYGKLRHAMGGNVKYAVSGSAPLGPRLGHFYHALGITILEGYGLTETTAPATVNLATKSKIGTVGPALPGVAVRIADDGEIEIKGVNVFKEYWKNPAATAETFDGDWLKTGDIGSFDSEGFLTITGRKKEIIVTAGGKNVAPAALEDPIRANPLVGQVVVVGDKKPFIAALVTLDPEMLPVWLNNNGEDAGMSVEEAATNAAVLAEVQRAIDAANENVSRAESIRKFTILSTELTEASGHLTPKMSIKRHVIIEDFSGQIESMYSGAPATEGHSIVH